MKEYPKKYRIKDIAKLAGVSAGTVDRVLHNRGEVSEISGKKVKEVLKAIDYHPNIFASTLASKKTYTFICILPHYHKGEYYEAVEEGISKAAAEFGDWNVSVKMNYFDQFDESDYRKVCEEIPDSHPDAVLIIPVYKEATAEFAATLKDHDIPYVFLDSQVEHTNPLAYFGQDSYRSGYLVARLLTENLDRDKEIVIFRILRHSQSKDNQSIARENGFMAYLKENNPGVIVHPLHLHAADEEESRKLMNHFFTGHLNVSSGVIFNSRAYMISEYLSARHLQHISLVGYDLLSRNVAGLKNGIIRYLIGQRPEKQGYNAIKALSRHFVLKQHVRTENFMPIDILTKENIDFFIDFE
ncbi:MAG: LacI family DNA-binding transcriptional regulator [Candidatus Azobacteroides sp.]|nr:LacI family DNA-binding transcriptional regulator [Candidatus Azobacteroides sp.]